jgi:N-acyl-D-aspartate/D-glutamate deacylase
MKRPAYTSLCLLTCLILASVSAAMAEEYDLVIRHGRIVDGTGNPGFHGDVAVKEGRIAAVGRVVGSGRAEVDAGGLVVAPGFIDVHTHSENIPMLPRAENFVRMGVTTVITGNCGSSALDVGGFFQRVQEARVSVNVATLVGHNTVRRAAMGGSFDRAPTEAELEKMKALVEKGMQDGAVGFSTGLIYLPGTFAKTEEIVALARVAAAHDGIYTSHMRNEGTRILSDSGVREMDESVPHPRGYGNNARVFARYVREVPLLRLEDAVRRMTSLPATTFRLTERGLVRAGCWADLVVFDPATVLDTATFDDPHHFPKGFAHVFVNGVAVVKDGQHTDARAGQVLRAGRT